MRVVVFIGLLAFGLNAFAKIDFDFVFLPNKILEYQSLNSKQLFGANLDSF